MLLALKLGLVPALVGAVSLVIRRRGPRVGGWLAALPLVAGPILFFLAVEQGEAFAARAALSTLIGVVAVAAFCLAYAWACLRRPWLPSLLVGWAAFGATVALLHAVRWQPTPGLAAAVASLAAVARLLPAPAGPPPPLTPPAWDLPLRMAAAVLLVLAVTGFAAWLGPGVSGALTPVPLGVAILLAFARAQQGPAAAIGLLRTFVPGMWGFALFCYVLTLGVVPLGRAAGFAAALAAQLALHGLILWVVERPAPSGALGRAPWRWP